MSRFTLTSITLLLLSHAVLQAEPAQQAAREILDRSGVPGGLVVHAGCGDARLTAALGTDKRYLVSGLEIEPLKVEKGRALIRSLGRI